MMSYIYFFKANNLTTDHLLIFFLKKLKIIIFQKIFDFITIFFDHAAVPSDIINVSSLQ